ncbi:unnamed protein product [Alternaria burnsii]|nr:unnamed protein product [Alternaria burnsii]
MGLQVIVENARGWTVPLGAVRRGLQVAPGTNSAMSVRIYPGVLCIYRQRGPVCLHPLDFPLLHVSSRYLRSHSFLTMYHLDGNPAPSDQSLFNDLLKITTSKWQSMLKKDTTPTREETASRPSVSRSSTQLSVPRSKE